MKAPDLIVVFNICGIGGSPNLNKYSTHISNLLAQRDVDLRLVISSCQNSHTHLKLLMDELGDCASLYSTQEHLTVNQTFNHVCLLARQEFGMPKAFLYVDSGCDVGGGMWQLRQLLENHVEEQAGMTAALVDKDTGFDLWRPGMSEDQLFTGDVYDIPIGQTCNLHFQIFDRSIVEAFGRPIPDVFRDFCTESIFSFMCASVGKGFGVWRNVRIKHDHGMDGGASGFPDDRGWRSFLAQAPRSAESIIADPEAKLCGIGYEECEGILMHDPNCYDVNGMCKDPARLQRFIAQNFFLPKHRFDYDKIVHAWIPQGKDMSNYQLPPEPYVPDIGKIQNRTHLESWLTAEGFNGKRHYIKQSYDANLVKSIQNLSADLIFLDTTSKDYKAVLDDIDAYWVKVKRIGIMAGSDYHNKHSKPNFDDSRNAVERWFSERKVNYRVLDDGTWIALRRW